MEEKRQRKEKEKEKKKKKREKEKEKKCKKKKKEKNNKKKQEEEDEEKDEKEKEKAKREEAVIERKLPLGACNATAMLMVCSYVNERTNQATNKPTNTTDRKKKHYITLCVMLLGFMASGIGLLSVADRLAKHGEPEGDGRSTPGDRVRCVAI